MIDRRNYQKDTIRTNISKREIIKPNSLLEKGVQEEMYSFRDVIRHPLKSASHEIEKDLDYSALFKKARKKKTLTCLTTLASFGAIVPIH
ncbi:MAG: hypothetical protein AABW47_01890 [Nanoarchaeota archaeon]